MTIDRRRSADYNLEVSRSLLRTSLLLATTASACAGQVNAPSPSEAKAPTAPSSNPSETTPRSEPIATSGLDCHVHLQAPDQGGAAAIEALDEASIARACVLSPGYRLAPGCEDFECAAQHQWTREMNDWTLGESKRAPARLLPFCGVPIGAVWSPEEVRRCAAAGGRGLKLHTMPGGISLRDPTSADALRSLLEVAAHSGLVVLIHIPMDLADEVRAFFEIAGSVPEARLLAAHQIAPNLSMLGEAPSNVWIEISGLALAPAEAGGAFVAAWRQFGMDRVIFGSDWPTLGLTPVGHVERLREYPLRDEERQQIMHDNGARILPIE